jgi:Right handed beta helix region
LHATPEGFREAFSKARGGETIELSAGDYGTFEGGAKDSTVTIRAARGARPRMTVAFASAAHLRLEGLTIAGADIGGDSRHITIARSRFTGAASVDATEMAGADILFERDVFSGIDVCPDCHEGRVTVYARRDGTRPVGVTVQNSLFNGGGNSDGIQVSAYGVRILHNEITAIHKVDDVHTDAIQLYGQSHTVIRGNYIHDAASGIMAPDGTSHELIEENVIRTDGRPSAITLGSDDSSIVRRNTLPGGRCDYHQPCGILTVYAGNSGLPSRGTVIEDNLLGGLTVSDSSQLGAKRGNLIGRAARGRHRGVGAPSGVGRR